MDALEILEVLEKTVGDLLSTQVGLQITARQDKGYPLRLQTMMTAGSKIEAYAMVLHLIDDLRFDYFYGELIKEGTKQ